MSYVTVFEITHEAIPLWFPVSFVVFGLFATVFLLDTRGLGFITKVVRYLVFLFACLWMVFTTLYFIDREHDIRAYRNGKHKVVEGPVEDCSWKGKTGCFRVRRIKFCQGTANQLGWDPPLRLGLATWPVGLAREGLPVRVAYYDEEFPMILRLDIGRYSR